MRNTLELTDSVPAVGGAKRAKLDIAEELVAFARPASFEADQYCALRHRVERLRAGSLAAIVAVTSPGPGDGKTVTALNLAGVLSRAGDRRVLVVDADLRRPAVCTYLRMPRSERSGLVDALADAETHPARYIRRLDALNLSVLPAGRAPKATYDLLGSSRMHSLLESVRPDFDFVIVDLPPLLPLADARAVERSVDGIIVVVAAHRTPKRIVTAALQQVPAEKLVAVALNGDDRPVSRYYRYYHAS